MFDTILLPIDLQHRSSWKQALPVARGLLNEGGTLHVLGIVHDVGNAWVASYLPKGYEKRALDEMKKQLGGFVSREAADLPNVTTHVGHGHIAETIIGMAENVSADLIVMSSRSPDEMRTFRIASQGDRVVRHSPISVLIVR
ncbi:universal stress protein [Paracoccus aerodenitrificans]|uniref:universal stress protein n=1 Tax=Paracoccus aerodenitrificans TaxID=3017781 RepID=UPI0022F13E22|nr:universal stress protein [Paracoccus aerodenitrificans]WBU64913.1 universal stress protein [Paracoccus aerodenitrificans]